MSAVIISIAEAVKDALNGASLSLAFTAERVYVPIHEMRDLAGLKVSVVPATLEGRLIDRSGRNLYDYAIHVGIQKSIGQGAMSYADINSAADPLMGLCEEIADIFDGKALNSTPVARCVDTKNEPIYSPLHIDEKRVFTSLITLVFRLGR